MIKMNNMNVFFFWTQSNSLFRSTQAISVSKNQKWRLDVDRKAGRYYISVNKMLGYRYDEEGNVVIQEDEAKIVRLIYGLYLDDMGTTAIADYLMKNGIKNRRGLVSWSVSSVNYILKNEKYVGDCLLQKAFSEDPLTKKKVYNHGQKDQYYIRNGHPAIIDRTTWDAVQNKFKEMGEKYHVHSYARQNMASKRVRYEFNGWIPCPYCGKYYLVKTNHYNGQPSKKHLMCYSNHKTKLCKSENYPLDVFKEILAKQIKILKSNIPSFKELLINEFSKINEEPMSNEIESLNSQIESLRNKYNDIKDYHDDYFISLQEETMNQINQLVVQRSILQNKENSVDVNTRVKQIIDNLKALPNEIEDVETINFKSIFAKAVIVDKGLIYFIVGNGDMGNLPLRPDLYFKSSIEYKVRKSVFTTQFGIIVF